jgi:hypothetical protein
MAAQLGVSGLGSQVVVKRTWVEMVEAAASSLGCAAAAPRRMCGPLVANGSAARPEGWGRRSRMFAASPLSRFLTFLCECERIITNRHDVRLKGQSGEWSVPCAGMHAPAYEFLYRYNYRLPSSRLAGFSPDSFLCVHS